MQIVFNDNSKIDMGLVDSPAKQFIISSIKHLQHAEINFQKWDNPFNNCCPFKMLEHFVKTLNIENIDTLDLSQQQYLNYLHKIYEKNYDGSTQWLQFHEQIHRCEHYNRNINKLEVRLDWREKAGPLIKKFDVEWLKNSQTIVEPGDVFIKWQELGKRPYNYWEDQEPENEQRICELAKPWINLKPNLHVSLENKDFLANKQELNFNKWWNQYHDVWCQHWNIPQWSLKDQYSVIKIGKVKNLNIFEQLLKKQIAIEKVLL